MIIKKEMEGHVSRKRQEHTATVAETGFLYKAKIFHDICKAYRWKKTNKIVSHGEVSKYRNITNE